MTPAPSPSAPVQNWPCPNNCHLWARGITPNEPMTRHHPNCEHVDSTLIDVWKVREPGTEHGCVWDSEDAAKLMAATADEDAPLEIVPMKMHREIYEQLPDFNGF